MPTTFARGIRNSQISTAAAVALLKLATQADGTILGNNSGATGVPLALTAAQIRTLLALVIGTDVQAFDTELAALASTTSAANKLPYFTGAGTATTTDFTAAGRAVIDDADPTAQRATLGVVIGTDVQAFNANLAAVAGLGTGASQVGVWTGASTAALDDWDRTSVAWTPVLEGASTAGSNGYDAQVGRYIRRGKLVTCWFRLHATGKSVAMVGNIQIGGLPFTSVNTTNQFGVLICGQAEQMIYTTFPGGLVAPNTTKCVLYKSTSGTAGGPAVTATADYGNNFGLIGAIVYEAA